MLLMAVARATTCSRHTGNWLNTPVSCDFIWFIDAPVTVAVDANDDIWCSNRAAIPVATPREAKSPTVKCASVLPAILDSESA